MLHLANKDVDEFSATLEKTLSDSKFGVKGSDNSEAAKTILYISRSRSQASPKPTPGEIAAVLDSNPVLSRSVIAALVTSITAAEAVEESVTASEAPVVQVPALVLV